MQEQGLVKVSRNLIDADVQVVVIRRALAQYRALAILSQRIGLATRLIDENVEATRPSAAGVDSRHRAIRMGLLLKIQGTPESHEVQWICRAAHRIIVKFPVEHQQNPGCRLQYPHGSQRETQISVKVPQSL